MISCNDTVHSIVTDPPYHLQDLKKRHLTENKYIPERSKGYKNKEWDGGNISFQKETWELAYDVLLPGGHLIAFSGAKTYHRLATAIEEAGFEIRDQLIWLNSQNMAQTRDVYQDIIDLGGSKGLESRKSISDAISNSGIRISEIARLMGRAHNTVKNWKLGIRNITKDDLTKLNEILGTNLTLDNEISENDKQWKGWGTVLKPGHDPIVLARKPMFMGVSNSVLEYGTSALNIEKTKFNDKWPTNVIHDGSNSVNEVLGDYSKYFYCAKATRLEKRDSKHPTVKPLQLMRWLVRMVTPKNGVVLDPFAGTGTTAEAAYLEGFNSIMIEKDEDYFNDMVNRMKNYDGAIFS